MKNSRLTIRGKLGLAFGVMVLLIVLVSALSIRGLNNNKDDFHEFVTGITLRTEMVRGIQAAVDKRAVAARNLVIATQHAEKEKEKTAVTKAHEEVQARLAQLKIASTAVGVTADERKQIEAIERTESAYGPVALQIIDLALRDQREEAITKINDECRPLLAALIAETTRYQSMVTDTTKNVIAVSQENFKTQRDFLVGVAVFAAIVALASGLLITRGVMLSLGAEPDALGEAARKVAEGNLTTIKGADVAIHGSVMQSLNQMQISLSSIVARVRGASDSISTGASEIAMGNVDLSQRTEQQASALEQTAATMEEFSSTIRNNAANAQSADQLAANASKIASEGGDVVLKVVETMKGINESSRKINDIIGVIDGIAFQTNILALNAAVEAARAGEQGRGFAVVASEVRSLAQRSAEAAKEIKALIHESVEKVGAGTTLVDQAGQTMGAVVEAIQRVSQAVGEISSASSEQSSGVIQIGQAINQMDQATQQNAALVEESAAAAQSLELQAKQLMEAVGAFKLDVSAERAAIGHRERLAIG